MVADGCSNAQDPPQYPPQDPLQHLPHTDDALFNSYSKQHETICLPDTRVGLLEEIYNWADGQDERCIFWLYGLAGTGKSTIARTVARRHFEQSRLGASFFFSRGGGDVGHAAKFVTSIAVQLARNVPALHPHVCNAITERTDIASQSLRDQWRQLILGPLAKLDGSGRHSYILAVDALDECDDDNNIKIIVQLLAEARSLKTARLRVFLTSRPEIPIRYGFCQIPNAEHHDFALHGISPSVVSHDIAIFIEYQLRLCGQEHHLDASWPGAKIIGSLVQSASGLFIWAATACRFIGEGGHFVADRLDTILKNASSTDDASNDGSSAEESDPDDTGAVIPERRLNSIYLTVLNSPIHKYKKQEKRKWYKLMRETLGAIVTLFSPLSASSLASLLDVSAGGIHHTLYEFHSILDVPADSGRPVRLHHPSFRDFLLNKERCGTSFWVDEEQAHRKLLDGCIRLMTTSLKQDICGAGAPGMLAVDIERIQVERSLSPELQYACLYWIQHLQKGGTQPTDHDQVHQFLQKHLLHWLEALGWLKKVPEGVHAIASLDLSTTVSILLAQS